MRGVLICSREQAAYQAYLGGRIDKAAYLAADPTDLIQPIESKSSSPWRLHWEEIVAIWVVYRMLILLLFGI